MFLRKKKTPEKSIEQLTGGLRITLGNRISWTAPKVLGQCALELAEDPRTGQYYKLDIVQRTPESSLLRFPATRFVYLPDGTVLGVLRSEVDLASGNDEEIESAMVDFQIESGLAIPTSDDKQELIGLLKTGMSP